MLLPEFQKIVDDYSRPNTVYVGGVAANVREAVTRCQELALRVPEMSDADIDAAYSRLGYKGPIHEGVYAVLAAYEAKRFAPVKRVFKCRLYWFGDGPRCMVDEDAAVDFNDPNIKWLGNIFEREV